MSRSNRVYHNNEMPLKEKDNPINDSRKSNVFDFIFFTNGNKELTLTSFIMNNEMVKYKSRRKKISAYGIDKLSFVKA